MRIDSEPFDVHGGDFPDRDALWLVGWTIARFLGGSKVLSRCFGLQLLDVVDEGKELPLRIHFVSGSQRESSQVVRVQIAEDRLDDAVASAVEPAPLAGIDPVLHRRGLRMNIFGLAAIEESHLPVRAGVRLAQALGFERAGLADRLRALEAHAASALDDRLGGTQLQCFSGGADTALLLGIESKVLRLKPLRLSLAGPPPFLDGLV